MPSIWVSEIVCRPTGPLTFRRMPSGLLHIMSYPFMPPTTLSGFLARLLRIGEGGDWPGYGEDWYGKGPGKEFTLTLGREYRALGAFPPPKGWVIHKTRRHGPKNFKHDEFSRLRRESHAENYELHHWDYLICEKLTGWVAAKTSGPLERLKDLENLGGKAGKEGYLFVSEVRAPTELTLAEGSFTPLGLLTPPLRPASGVFYNLYGHHWDDQYEWTNGETGGVTGYQQVGAWWGAESVSGPYWELEPGRGFQAEMPDAFLTVDQEPFYES